MITLQHRSLRPYRKTLQQINDLAPSFKQLTDEELQAKTNSLKGELKQHGKLETILPQAYATIREAAFRVLGMFPYDVQVLGALVLNDNKIAEMKTGEGKTLTAILPLYLNALTGKSTILVTANPYLARRDAAQMEQVFNWLGLTVGCPLPHDDGEELTLAEKREQYNRDIVYTTHVDLGFDYLREKITSKKEDLFFPELYFVLIDEVDAALLDSAQMPLIISGNPKTQSDLFKVCDEFVKILNPKEDIETNSLKKSVWLTQSGVQQAESYFQVKHLFGPENHDLVKQIRLALQANFLYTLEKDYIRVQNDIKLIDDKTGRILFGTKLNGGLHQAIEAKENVPITSETSAMATVTYQNLFKLFPKISGMTGTAKTSEKELVNVYGLPVICIPTRKPTIRKDFPDQIYTTKQQKQAASLQYILEAHAKGRPVLIITNSIADSETYSHYLLQEGIPHNVLNAHNVPKEAAIISNAGQLGEVTIATPLAGRGTDIILGEGVSDLGGLLVVGTEKLPNTRIELQLRGRAGRQGDMGSSIFFVSLEDELLVTNASPALKKFYKKAIEKPEKYADITSPRMRSWINQIQNMADIAAERARKHAEEMDESIRLQRTIIYQRREEIIHKDGFQLEDFLPYLDKVYDRYFKGKKAPSETEVKQFLFAYLSTELHSLPVRIYKNHEATKKYLRLIFEEIYLQKQAAFFSDESFQDFQRNALLKAIDGCWLDQVDYLQQYQLLIDNRRFSQKNPIYEFHKEAFRSFEKMEQMIQEKSIQHLTLSYITTSPMGEVKVLY